MSIWWTTLAGAALGCALFLALPARPVEAQDASSQARALFGEGRSSYDSGDYEGAIDAWNRAHELDPRPLILFNLEQAYERLGRLSEALEVGERFLRDSSPSDPNVPQAQSRLAHLRERLARTAIRFVGGPEGAAIFIDGQDMGRLPRPDALRVEPGSHRILIRAAGYDDFSSVIGVSAGQAVDVPVEMRRGRAGTEPPPSPVTTGGGGGGISMVGLAVMLGGVAVAAGGVVTGVLALGAAGGDGPPTQAERDDAYLLATLTDVLIPVGGAAAITGLILMFVLDPGGDEGGASASVLPVLGPTSVGVQAAGRF